MSNLEDKFLKYKSKYLELKNNNMDMIGGSKNNIEQQMVNLMVKNNMK